MPVCDAGPGPGQAVTSLVFPAYNPGPRAELTWHAVQRFLHEAPGTWEVLFVCDGCTDSTPVLLEQLGRSVPGQVRILSYAPNRGKGYAVRRGLEAATGHWRLFTDVDLAYGFDDVLRVARALWAGADVAIASRTHPESRVVLPPRLQGYAYRRYLQSQLFTALARFLLPLRQQDTQAGLKGMTAAVAQRVLPQLRCDGFGFDCELLTACACHGIPVAEVPVCLHYEDAESTTNVGAMRRMVRDLLRIRRAWRAAPARAIPLEQRRRAA